MLRAVARRAPQARARASRVISAVTLIESDADIRAQAAVIEPTSLRSIDAMHVATALRISDALDAVVTYDARMAEAAEAVGLAVLAPA